MITIHLRRWLLAGLVAGAAWLTGCANQPMRLALTEMGTTSDSEYGLFSLRLQRGVTITGLAAEETVGTITSDSDKFSIVEQFKRIWPTRNDLPDSMTPRLANGPDSEIRVRRFASDATIDDLMALRDLLQDAQQQLSLAAQTQLKAAVLRQARSSLSKEEALADELPVRVSTRLATLYPEGSWKTTADLGSAIDAADQLAKLDVPGSVLDRIRQVLRKKGVIVTQWQGDLSVNANVDSAVGSAGIERSRSVGGYLILGEPQVHTLYLGDDIPPRILCQRRDAKGQPACIGEAFEARRQYLTIYQLRARHVVYAEAARSATRAGVRLKLDELAKAATAAGFGLNPQTIEALKLDVEAGYAALQSAGTSGVLDAGSVNPQDNAGLSVYTLAALETSDELKTLLKHSIPVINMRIALRERMAEKFGR
ncbi:hypothetical protein [Leptothrix discophora]|uniref:Uncharacterized protein n=1 Tax=Leptothrix discophora TaxID=89 RepID=A0ABT9G907_LEPDI|nr:hypothetical protein [Leptothrix discophora]MDP4302960.1 hypothetical protein [Leptothrix discophora]